MNDLKDPVSGHPRLRVLVVDDDQDAADMMAAAIETLGHESFVAYDGRSALSMALGCRPHVVFLDLVMPDFSGFDVVQSLRRSPELRSARIIALTGLGGRDEVDATLRFGVQGYLVKPASIDVIGEVLRHAGQGDAIVAL